MADRVDSRTQLPRGTVTLFFADVEGSTRLIHALGDRYAEARARARELVRASAAARGGHEVDWAGDGAFLTFERARDAVAAAVELQRALADEPWPLETPVRMRIGLHTGEPELGDEGYVGMDVHIAARICSAAHGGQIVLSRATRDFVADDQPEVLSFRALGSHRLKDVGRAHQLFQLVADGLEESFPPLQALGGATLPVLHHRLVGRRDDLAEIQALLAQGKARLVTITGPGGAGKSRLALEAAAGAALERPVHLVGLASISDAALIPAEIARALGVRESGGRGLLEQIADALEGTGTLLVLDNLEHLDSAPEHVRALLDRVTDLGILATSRVPLRLSGEHVLPLEPLPLAEAVLFFADLATAQGVRLPEDVLPAVREICRRLDGLPLAIELVAARLVVLPPAQLLRALDEGLALDMEGPVDLPTRQRTLRVTLDWSYGLLTETQRALLGALAVFAGGCTLDDGRVVSGAPRTFLSDLEGLVAGSLLRSDATGDGGVRLSMLETVREDALDRLAAEGKLESARERHAERFVELALAAEIELAGPDQAAWLERLENELDNVRVTLDWCLSSGRVEDGLRAISALERFWRAHGHVSEARRWLSLGLELADGVPAEVRADALWTAAQQATAQSDWDAAQPLLTDALALFRSSGRGREVAFSLADLGWVALVRGDTDQAAALCEEALVLARSLDDERAMSAALNNLGEVRSVQGDHRRALAHYEEVVALRRMLDDPMLVSNAMLNLGYAAFRSGDLGRSRQALEESLALARDLGDELQTASALFMLAELSLFAGEPALAEERIRASLAVYTALDSDRDRADCLVVLGGVSASNGAFEEAARLLGAAEALRGNAPLDPFELEVLERIQPELDDALGKERFGELRMEGARIGAETLSSRVVTAAVRH